MRAQYTLVSMMNSLARWLNAKQTEGESLLDYAKLHKQLTDVVKSQFGTALIDENIKRMPEYTSVKSTEQQKMLDDGFEEWSAYLLLNRVDMSKYGLLAKGFVN